MNAESITISADEKLSFSIGEGELCEFLDITDTGDNVIVSVGLGITVALDVGLDRSVGIAVGRGVGIGVGRYVGIGVGVGLCKQLQVTVAGITPPPP